jgi:predicted MFS family arabinose efflux permease
VVLYLLLPLHAAAFGVTLPEVGLLLAANRLVRIVGYSHVAALYAHRGPRVACLLAVGAAAVATLSYSLASGVWLLLVARLLWGLAFAAMNIANQALPTALLQGAARRSGRARAIVAVGPMLGLLAGAALAEIAGPRPVFVVLGLLSLVGFIFARRLPDTVEGRLSTGPRLALPAAMDVWSFFLGLTLDGLFIVGLSVLASAALPDGAGLAVGAAMALRYVAEIALSGAGGALAEKVGARILLIALSLAASGGLILLASGGVWLWAGALATTVLRALLQPLPGPVVAEDNPGPARIPALARQATWRDLGAGAGPLLAGLLLPIAPALAIYGGAALLLAGSSLMLKRRGSDGT